MTSEKRFITILEAVQLTGLSSYYIRQGCREGWIPHIMCGCKMMINAGLFLEKLDAMSKEEREAE